MKRYDAEFLRYYYSTFTLEYHDLLEEIFYNRIILTGSLILNILLGIICAITRMQ